MFLSENKFEISMQIVLKGNLQGYLKLFFQNTKVKTALLPYRVSITSGKRVNPIRSAWPTRDKRSYIITTLDSFTNISNNTLVKSNSIPFPILFSAGIIVLG